MPGAERIVKECFESVRNTFEDDTEQTLKQMEGVRQLNTATTLTYIKKEEELKVLARKAEHVEALNNELRDYSVMLDTMESRLNFVEQLTNELDSYTRGL